MSIPGMTEADRQLIDTRFSGYGEAWKGGLAALERDFVLEGRGTETSVVLAGTMRAPPRLRYELTYQRATEQTSHGRPVLPDGLQLDEAQLAQIDRILRAEREWWINPPFNGYVGILDLTDGLAALEEWQRRLEASTGLSSAEDVLVRETRLVEGDALLYYRDHRGRGIAMCCWFDLARDTFSGIMWPRLPLLPYGRRYTASEIAAIDTALREHGDFGHCGDVRSGLRDLVTHMQVSIRDTGDTWHISASPPDYHGHALYFDIDKATGTIGTCAAGHLIPPPDCGEVRPVLDVDEAEWDIDTAH
ncbi:MAG: hypothetical protein ACOCYP_10470 [Planctomycetota bacterium]